MNPVRYARTVPLLVLVVLLASCSGGDGRDIVTGSSEGAATTAGEPEGVPATSQGDVATTDVAVPIPATSSTPPSTAADGPTGEGSDTTAPSDSGVATDSRNVYAFAAAQAIAAAANNEGLDDADADATALILETASEAAYEIEYPSAVEYLEVEIEEGVVTITTEGDFGDGAEIGTAYVCIVDGTAIASETACRS